MFVLVVQLFRRVRRSTNWRRLQSEPPFAVAQLLVLVTFIVLGTLAVKRAMEIPNVIAVTWRS